MKMNNFSIYNMYLIICKNLSVPPSTVACPPSKKFLVTALDTVYVSLGPGLLV